MFVANRWRGVGGGGYFRTLIISFESVLLVGGIMGKRVNNNNTARGPVTCFVQYDIDYCYSGDSSRFVICNYENNAA